MNILTDPALIVERLRRLFALTAEMHTEALTGTGAVAGYDSSAPVRIGTERTTSTLHVLEGVGLSLGFRPPDDERMVGTVEAIRRELLRDGFVLRYRPGKGDGGLPGGEGVLVACSFWLVDALVGIGGRDEAEALFEKLLGIPAAAQRGAGPNGAATVGNTPQAFSHFALINPRCCSRDDSLTSLNRGS